MDHFADGVWVVELAPLVDPELVNLTVATAIGLREEPGRPILETLVDALSDRHLLIVLDNCEHVRVASAKLADTVLRRCPRLCVLATSRESLGSDGERLYRVPPLSLPEPGETLTPNEARTFDAVQLFVERAMAHQRDLVLDGTSAGTVVSLCRALDGMPLAIELAAARAGSLSIGDIALRLGDRFRLLSRSRSTALPRHQTLRALIDWSYDLLNEREQAVLCRLSVFSGGWRLEAAGAVCSRGSLDAWEVMDVLSSLVDKSLVQAEVANGDIRYRLLETIRRYSAEKLAELGQDEEHSTRWSHARVSWLSLRKRLLISAVPRELSGSIVFIQSSTTSVRRWLISPLTLRRSSKPYESESLSGTSGFAGF